MLIHRLEAKSASNLLAGLYAMTDVHRAFEGGGFQTKILLTVRDEIVFDMLKSERETAMPVIEHAMKTALPMCVDRRDKTIKNIARDY
jgi:DNA polymerase I-like protein with 3'-5' exonuclease and polymerase domains